ncbi:hypothetical protein HRbin12_01237 [bacterium HR12]|nr:hypothetical protein HRbin12_01237 [bacterium HR12]
MSSPARHRRSLAHVLPGALLAVLVLVPGCFGLRPSAGSSHAHPTAAASTGTGAPSGGYHGVVLPEPVRVRPFVLTDQRGEPFRVPQDLDGRVSLLSFGYTHCPDVCPGTLAAIAVALRGLPPEVRDAVDVVFVTVDPARDTVPVLRDYVGLFSEDFVALTGTEDEIVEALARFGFGPPVIADLGGGEYAVGHPAGVLAITPDGYARLEYPFGTTVEAYREDLARLVEEGWRQP